MNMGKGLVSEWRTHEPFRCAGQGGRPRRARPGCVADRVAGGCPQRLACGYELAHGRIRSWGQALGTLEAAARATGRPVAHRITHSALAGTRREQKESHQ